MFRPIQAVWADTVCFGLHDVFRLIQGVSVKAPIQENFADTFSVLLSAETYQTKQKCICFRPHTSLIRQLVTAVPGNRIWMFGAKSIFVTVTKLADGDWLCYACTTQSWVYVLRAKWKSVVWVRCSGSFRCGICSWNWSSISTVTARLGARLTKRGQP